MRFIIIVSIIMGFIFHATPVSAEAWKRHIIDDSSLGADGIRLADVNNDGFMDIATGWEEGSIVRVYINPGPEKAKERWPAVTVARVNSPEDAVFADLDRDGSVDVVSCTEGENRTVFVSWAPKDVTDYLNPEAWNTEPIQATQGKQMWMFGLPMQIDGKRGGDIVVGSKGENATIGWLESPENPRDMAAWKFHPLCEAGWIMSLIPIDMDKDGDMDILASDRFGKNSGVMWLENPGPKKTASGARWKFHSIGASGKEVMFLTAADLDGDGLVDILATTREGALIYLRRRGKDTWESYTITLPFEIKHGKAVSVGDIDLDGRLDIVHTANTYGDRSQPAVIWMRYKKSATDPVWDSHDIGGPEGIKFDLVELLDLDADGDLDIITCEERDNLGVIWYENPTKN